MTSGGLSTFSMWLYQKLSVKKNKKNSCRQIEEVWSFLIYYLLFIFNSLQLWMFVFSFPRKPPTTQLGIAGSCCKLFWQPGPSEALLSRRSEGLQGQEPWLWAWGEAEKSKVKCLKCWREDCCWSWSCGMTGIDFTGMSSSSFSVSLFFLHLCISNMR